jgi:hypothetical protein
MRKEKSDRRVCCTPSDLVLHTEPANTHTAAFLDPLEARRKSDMFLGVAAVTGISGSDAHDGMCWRRAAPPCRVVRSFEIVTCHLYWHQMRLLLPRTANGEVDDRHVSVSQCPPAESREDASIITAAIAPGRVSSCAIGCCGRPARRRARPRCTAAGCSTQAPETPRRHQSLGNPVCIHRGVMIIETKAMQ